MTRQEKENLLAVYLYRHKEQSSERYQLDEEE